MLKFCHHCNKLYWPVYLTPKIKHVCFFLSQGIFELKLQDRRRLGIKNQTRLFFSALAFHYLCTARENLWI